MFTMFSMFTIRALHLLPPTTVAVIRVTEIIFAYILQSIFMDKVGVAAF